MRAVYLNNGGNLYLTRPADMVQEVENLLGYDAAKALQEWKADCMDELEADLLSQYELQLHRTAEAYQSELHDAWNALEELAEMLQEKRLNREKLQRKVASIIHDISCNL